MTHNGDLQYVQYVGPALLAARRALCTPQGRAAMRWSCPPKGASCGFVCRRARNLVSGALSTGLLPTLCFTGGSALVERTISALCAGDDAQAQAAITQAQAHIERAKQLKRLLPSGGPAAAGFGALARYPARLDFRMLG